MAITINPADVIKYFLSDRCDKRKRAAEYLESIAFEASALADIWKGVVSKLSENYEYEIPENVLRNNLLILE